jgi:ABC-2 type transport system permease protein
MIAATHAEWTKLRTLPATLWLLVGAIVVSIGGSATIAALTHVSSHGAVDTTRLALGGIDLGQAVVVVFAVIVIAEEYGTGMIRATVSAMPRRLGVLVAKAVIVAALTFVVGILSVAGSLLTGRLLLPGAGLTPANGYPLVSIGNSQTMRAAIGTILYLVLVALLSLGIATIIRDTAVSIAATLGLLYIPLILALAVNGAFQRHLEQLAPMSAGLAIQATTNLTTLPITPWAGLGVLTVWTLGSLLTAGTLLQMRDA